MTICQNAVEEEVNPPIIGILAMFETDRIISYKEGNLLI